MSVILINSRGHFHEHRENCQSGQLLGRESQRVQLEMRVDSGHEREREVRHHEQPYYREGEPQPRREDGGTDPNHSIHGGGGQRERAGRVQLKTAAEDSNDFPMQAESEEEKAGNRPLLIK